MKKSLQVTVNSLQKMQRMLFPAVNGRRSTVNSSRGFTLLMATLIASIVLSIGSAIYSLVSKQVILSSLGRDSQYAFYAADSAAECALYWDIRNNYFASSTPAGVVPVCASQTLSISGPSPIYPYTMSFEYTPNGYCADVSVTKSLNGSVVNTLIHADGFSTSCANKTTSRTTLQRSVEISY